jgi:hypothetical protein
VIVVESPEPDMPDEGRHTKARTWNEKHGAESKNYCFVKAFAFCRRPKKKDYEI